MVWFKVDDGFYDHPKVIEAGNAAIGLWTRCGSWASKQLTDGFIPGAIVAQFGRRRDAERLIDCDLWSAVEGGYQMHDFNDHNPTSEQVKRDRKAAAERQARARESRRESRRDYTRESRRESHDPDPTRPDPVITSQEMTTSSSRVPVDEPGDLGLTSRAVWADWAEARRLRNHDKEAS
jgi:hypothetical protein